MVDVLPPVSPIDPNQQFQKPVVLSQSKTTFIGKRYLILIFIFIVVLISIVFYYFTNPSTYINEKQDPSDIKAMLDTIPEELYDEYLKSPDLNSDSLTPLDIEKFNKRIVDITVSSNTLYISECKAIPLALGLENGNKIKIVNEGDDNRKIFLSFQDNGVINIPAKSEIEVSISFPTNSGIFTYGCDLKDTNSGYFVLR